MIKTITMSDAEFSEMTFGMGNPGVCLACGDIDEFAGCEPDAENYECANCGKRRLWGLEQALIAGYLDIA